MANEPGWYPDPWRPGQRRWWSGSDWTDHTFDPSNQPPALAPQQWGLPDPLRERSDEQRAAVWAKRAFIGFVSGRVGGGLASIVVLNHVIDDAKRFFDTNGQAQPSYGGMQLLQLPLTVLSVGGLVGIVIWAFKAGTVARNLRYPASHSPGWAVAGWLVPIVNFWFPYQSVRDCLAPQNAARRTVAQWWTAYLLASFLWFPAVVVSLLSSVALALAVALPAMLASIAEVLLALRVVDAVEADHSEAVKHIAA